MFWQICQKLMLSGFLSSGNLCLIHHLKLFWPHTASTASDRKGAKIQHEFWWFCQKIFFKNIKIKSSNYWVQDSGRLWSPHQWFSRPLKSLQPHWPQQPLQPHWPQQPLKPNFPPKLTDPNGLIIISTKITNIGDFWGNGSSKIQFFTNIWDSFWQRPLRLHEVKKVSNSGSGINFHYSGSHWASVFGRFVKTSGQAKSLLCINS